MRRQLLAALVALFVLTFMARAAAPAPVLPAAGAGPKLRLEALKKRLPTILQAWEKKSRWRVEARLVRLTGPAEAKLTFRDPDAYVFSVWLRYYDGRWTTDRSEFSWATAAGGEHRTVAARLLMLMIDESEEQP